MCSFINCCKSDEKSLAVYQTVANQKTFSWLWNKNFSFINCCKSVAASIRLSVDCLLTLPPCLTTPSPAINVPIAQKHFHNFECFKCLVICLEMFCLTIWFSLVLTVVLKSWGILNAPQNSLFGPYPIQRHPHSVFAEPFQELGRYLSEKASRSMTDRDWINISPKDWMKIDKFRIVALETPLSVYTSGY